jgi:hypothetical protein
MNAFDEAMAKAKVSHEFYRREFTTGLAAAEASMKAVKSLETTNQALTSALESCASEIKSLRADMSALLYQLAHSVQAKDDKAGPRKAINMKVTRDGNDRISGAILS